jgi:predicted lipoprotein with Yx(FWY)xxD motif
MRARRFPYLVGAFVTTATVLALATVFIVPSGAKSTKAPVQLTGKVTNKGTKTAKGGKISIEADDEYFSPTFVKAKPGTTLTVALKNDGKMEHTFTIAGQAVNVDLQPGAKATATVTVPADGALEFFCEFHGELGMRGAIFTSAGQTVTNQAARTASTVKVTTDVKYGNILVDNNGLTLYQRDQDTPTTVTCTGACAGIWPPVVVTSTSPIAGPGVDASKLTTITGPNGTQVVYNGHPLYRYGQDASAGSTAGEGVAGVWWIVGGDGSKVTAATAPTTTAPASK